ncbi:MAG: TIGR03013 family XrtA/PEP-CTERM system glycosyltransferase [Desulfobacterales bacterium]|nr:TIGR03013 family XrtA/PEP-CTERM system glycosyltransferase [Desulfobacterales bacterium]
MPYLFSKYYPWRNLLFVFGESGIIFLIINSVFLFWVGFLEFQSQFSLYLLRALVVTFVFQLVFYYSDLYDLHVIPRLPDHFLNVIQAFGLGCIVLALIYFLFPFLTMPSRIFVSGLAGVGLAVFFWRFLYFKILEKRMFVQPVALIGAGEFAEEIISAIDGQKDCGFKIEALFAADGNPRSRNIGRPIFSDFKELTKLCTNRKIGKIVVALDEKRGVPLHELIQYKFIGIEILDGARFYEALTGKVPVKRINPSWLIFSDGFHIGRFKRMLKRALDVVAASSLFLISLPIFFLTALIVKLESAGGVFYRQKRVGENEKIFELIKFRSMKESAEQEGPVWAQAGDARVTKFGRFIRETRIDELPQLINVLKGDMSFVGPRPERPVFVESLVKEIPFYGNRHHVKPGITGWAQINYPYGASVEDALRKLEYDLYYIKNLSIALDLLTIFQTIKVVLFRKGAR